MSRILMLYTVSTSWLTVQIDRYIPIVRAEARPRLAEVSPMIIDVVVTDGTLYSVPWLQLLWRLGKKAMPAAAPM